MACFWLRPWPYTMDLASTSPVKTSTRLRPLSQHVGWWRTCREALGQCPRIAALGPGC